MISEKLENSLFHVHSYRCGHAQKIEDEAYVKRAVELGAEHIWFTDHAPFPKDPLGNRMEFDQLEEYLSTLFALKQNYQERIDIHIGLEIEYLPLYREYYDRLLEDPRIELLLLGQHVYECLGLGFNFLLPRRIRREDEMEGLAEAMIEGMETGLFPVCAHPDRIFRYREEWGKREEETAERIIRAALANGVMLEQNASSMQTGMLYRPEFWRLLPENAGTVYGLDAHAVSELHMAPEAQE